MNRKKVALIGCGNLGCAIAKGVVEKLGGEWELLGVMSRRRESAEALAAECGCRTYCSLDEILTDRPDVVVEAANPQAATALCRAVLSAGISFMPLSVGAFADRELLADAEKLARENDARLYICSGAIGGLDFMQSAMMYGAVEAGITNTKNPKSLEGAPYLENRELSETETEVIFSGNAEDAIRAFPKNVNVAVCLALATNGVESTNVRVISAPGKNNNTHTIEMTGDFGEATIEISSRPTAGNPRSSGLAAASVLAKLKNITSAITFC